MYQISIRTNICVCGNGGAARAPPSEPLEGAQPRPARATRAGRIFVGWGAAEIGDACLPAFRLNYNPFRSRPPRPPLRRLINASGAEGGGALSVRRARRRPRRPSPPWTGSRWRSPRTPRRASWPRRWRRCTFRRGTEVIWLRGWTVSATFYAFFEVLLDIK